MKFKIALFFFLIFSHNLCAQELLPFVENFTKSNYNGDNQVWSVTQGSDNAMYFANNHYFLRYNGVKWDKYILPNKTIIRSVFSDGNRIYSGSYTEFGFWVRKNGEMIYESLSKGKNLFNGYSNNEEIWKIVKFQDKIYFQSFNELFVYDGQNIEKIRIPFQISYCFVIDEKFYVATVKEGIFEYNNKTFEKVEQWKLLENNVVHAIDKNQNQLYFFTQKNGVYLQKNNQLIPWNTPLNEVLKKEIIITAKFINDKKLVIGTAFRGLYLVDINDNSYKNISRNNSLKNNSVLSIGFDKENDLWLGLDNGISHVEINSPFSIFSDNTGVLGSVYSVSFTNEGYLLGSNHGVFKYENKNLEVIPNSQGQVWDIQKIDNQFVIGHNDGTFLYNGKELVKQNQVSGGWKILKSQFDNKIYQANYSGIVMYDIITDFKKYQIIQNLTKPIKNIAQVKPLEIWAVDNYRSLYRIKFNPDFKLDKIENITQKNKIENDFEVKLFQFKSEMLFFIDNTWYRFNSLTDKLEKNALFNANFASVSEIVPIDDDNFIVLKDKFLYVIHQIGEKFIWELIPEKYYEGKIINQDTKVFKEDDKLIMNLDDGFFTFKLKNAVIINQNVVIEAFSQGVSVPNGTTVKHNTSVEINVISEYFGYNRAGLFFQLNSSKEYIPIQSGNFVLNNLSSGDQNVEIFQYDGERFNLVSNFNFFVAEPWYLSVWMFLGYILVISILFFLYYRWNKIRYQEKLKLKEEELKHQKEILQIELEAENKLKLQEYEKHILEIQVQTKASEVAGKSLSIAKQSEMIETIKKILETESDLTQLKSKINKSIKVNAINRKEWENFEKNILQSHEDFVHRLTTKYPSLTSKDIKLCIYLKMNLSSKEIAPLMNISYRGVELHRYRLRKKLELHSDDNLSNFMINL
ncbi:MAG: LuxR C-terminal-related transcriptional regulator [Flavobacterium sp.]|nr:LuxR C-terminal-related transcriptional regulator [Flavobacterium sp.]